jgi:DNA adenine methylase
MARPFLKWAGGKAKLAPQILAAMPPSVSAYVEPFAGAAAVFFALEAARPAIPAVINDANAELVETFTVLRDSHAELGDELRRLSLAYTSADPEVRRDLYYEARSADPATPVGRAARFIFLNKTCYNGLFRVNASGGFNVPHGRYRNPRIFDEDLLNDCSTALQHTDLRSEDFASICNGARPGQFVYLDPPYHPLSATANFTGYTRSDFGQAEQRRLRDTFEDLTSRGVAAMLSNSEHPFVSDLYGGLGYNLRSVTMSRAINSKGSGRAPVGELLIDNFKRIDLNSPES